MLKARTTVLTAILTLGTQVFATPIVVLSVKDGFVIGTNGRDTGGIEVCKIHYAGSTVVVRAATLARWPKTTNPNEIKYNSTLLEWGALDPQKNMSDIVITTRLFFIQSTEHIAELEERRLGSQRTKAELLEKAKQGVVVAGFRGGLPTLYFYTLLFINGSFNSRDGYPMGPFQNKALSWSGQDTPLGHSLQDVTVETAHEFVRKQLQAIHDVEPDKIAFGEPWEIVHLTKDGVEWLEGHKALCEKDRLKFAPH